MLIGQSLYILKNFEFDVPVDETLISMEPPAGYTLSDKQFDMTQFTEQDFITVLRLWVEHLLGGSFPQSLSAGDLMSLTPQMGEKIGQLNISDEEKTQLGMTMGKGFVFFQQLDPTGATWHYAGSGVKLGDAEQGGILVSAERLADLPRNLRRLERQRCRTWRFAEVTLELCPRLAVAPSGDGFLFCIFPDSHKMPQFFAFRAFDVRLYNGNR